MTSAGRSDPGGIPGTLRREIDRRIGGDRGVERRDRVSSVD